MGRVILPQRWQRKQPSGAKRLAITDLTNGLVDVSFPPDSRGLTAVNAPAIVPTGAGLAFKCDGSSSYLYRTLPGLDGYTFGYVPWTIFGVIQGAAGDLDKRVYSIASASDVIIALGSGAEDAAKGRVWVRSQGADSSSADTSGTVFEDGLQHTFALSYDGTTVRSYVDGTADASITFTMVNYSGESLEVGIGAVVRAGSGAAFGQAGLALGLAWTRALSAYEHRILAANPWQVFAPMRRPVFASAGGAVTHATSGALAAGAATIAGTAAHHHASTGALSAQAATISGTATHFTLHATSGALSADAATIAGTAAHQHATTGALAAADATIAGAAAHQHVATGALTASAATVAGAAAHEHASTGALAAAAATVAGTAAHEHASTGALAAADATVAGTATHLTLHATSGALDSQAATVAGTAAHQHVATGALASDAATIAGDALRETPSTTHEASGALAAADASVAGTATHFLLHATSGALTAQDAAIVGTALHLVLHATSGALEAGSATISGVAQNGDGADVDVATDPRLIARHPNVRVEGFGRKTPAPTPAPTPASAQITNIPGHPPVPPPLNLGRGAVAEALAKAPAPAPAPAPVPAPAPAPAARAPVAPAAPHATPRATPPVVIAAPVAPAAPAYVPNPVEPRPNAQPVPTLTQADLDRAIAAAQQTLLARLEAAQAAVGEVSNRLHERVESLADEVERLAAGLAEERAARAAAEQRARNQAKARTIAEKLLG